MPKGKRRRGAGHYVGFDADDALRIMLSKEFLRVGVQAEQHPFAVHRDGAAAGSSREAVGVAGPAGVSRAGFGPRADPRAPAQPEFHDRPRDLTTVTEAVAWLKGPHTVVVIDVGALINQIEARTGRPFGHDAPSRGSQPPNA